MGFALVKLFGSDNIVSIWNGFDRIEASCAVLSDIFTAHDIV